MNIAIIGYGKMGKEIEKIAIERGHNIVIKVNSENKDENLSNYKIDVAIEFSNPENVINNIKKCFELKIPIIVGTTAWENNKAEIIELCNSTYNKMITASNFSIGVNIFFKLNEYLTKLISRFDDYKAELTEIHHTQKLDAPSGTAITLANGLIDNHKVYNKWKLNKVNNDNELIINAIREENVPGTHLIKFENEIDFIEIKHLAKNRKGFALGAVLCAEWLFNKDGYGNFDISEVLF